MSLTKIRISVGVGNLPPRLSNIFLKVGTTLIIKTIVIKPAIVMITAG